MKPFDAAILVASAKKTGYVVTAENQNVLGGLGGAVCEILSEQFPVKVKRLGMMDRFGEVGTLEYLCGLANISPTQIAETCIHRKVNPKTLPSGRVFYSDRWTSFYC